MHLRLLRAKPCPQFLISFLDGQWTHPPLSPSLTLSFKQPGPNNSAVTADREKKLRRHVRPWDDKVFTLLFSWPYLSNVTVSTLNVSGCKDVGKLRKCSIARADSRTGTRFQGRNDSRVLFSEQQRQRAHGRVESNGSLAFKTDWSEKNNHI